MTTQPARDGELVENPNDHLGIIHVEAGRLMAIYSGLEYTEILSELYIILHRCCQLYDKSRGWAFSTYAHAACRISRGTVVERIKTGRGSEATMSFDRKTIRYDESWQQASERDDGFARVDHLDEIDFLLAQSNEIGVAALFATEFDNETQESIGQRFCLSKSAISAKRAKAIKVALWKARANNDS